MTKSETRTKSETTRTSSAFGHYFGNHALDVVSLDVVDPLRYSGSEAVRKRAREWFALYQSAIGCEVRDLRIAIGDS